MYRHTACPVVVAQMVERQSGWFFISSNQLKVIGSSPVHYTAFNFHWKPIQRKYSMPYEIAKVGSKFVVRKKTDKSKVFGTHPSYAKALAQLRAIEVNSHEHGSMTIDEVKVRTPINFHSANQGRRVEVRKGN
jgi:hypothetical protein